MIDVDGIENRAVDQRLSGVCQSILDHRYRKEFCEYISRPLIFTVLAGDVKFFNGVTVDGGLDSADDGVVTVDPHTLLVMRNRK